MGQWVNLDAERRLRTRGLSRRSGDDAARWTGRGAGDLRREQPYPRRLRRVRGGRLCDGRAGAVRSLPTQRRHRLYARRRRPRTRRSRRMPRSMRRCAILRRHAEPSRTRAGSASLATAGVVSSRWMSAARIPGFACAITYYGGGMTEAIAEQPRCPVLRPLRGTRQRDPARPCGKARRRASAGAGLSLPGGARIQL